MRFSRGLGPLWLSVVFLLLSISSACADSCSVAQPHPLTPEQIAIIAGNYEQAESLYRQDMAKSPKDAELTAGLVRTLLFEENVSEAEATVREALKADPQSPELLTALAEVQYREGLPWEEEKTLQAAQAHGLCYARMHLALANLYRLSSFYATALGQIKLAHQLDAYDPAIRRVWIQTLPLEQRIDELKKYLAARDGNSETTSSAQRELAALESRLQNRGNGCHLASAVITTNIDFTGIMIDAEHVRGWGLDVLFNGHKSRLEVDTGASGLYISRAVAEHAGLKPVGESKIGGIGDRGAQSGYTAYADSIKVGDLEFKNCLVEVSDRNNIVGTDGLIGMDVFSNFLVTLDFPFHRLTLGPLPAYPGTAQTPVSLNTEESTPAEDKSADAPKDSSNGIAAASGPHDRYVAPEMKDWTRVYRIGHQLMVPTGLNGKAVHLFIVDTGSGRTLISTAAAREVTTVHNEDGSLHGISGNVHKVYSGDKVVVRFAGLQQETDGMLSFDTSGLSENLGMEVSGLLGFDLLHLLVVKIDYRDGLVGFQYSQDRGYQHIR